VSSSPDARVIHCRRDPLDTCFSCFRQNFHATHTYATRLADLAAYWRGYDRWMTAWTAAPSLPTVELRYEDLVASPEVVTRSLLSALGLPWDPACLRFFESTRSVNTASYDQVRRPIYKDSVGRAGPYRPRLGPLVEGMRG